MIVLNILSLFDGISSGQIALERAGINYENYFASEIYDKAIAITQKNYPNTIQLGDIRGIDEKIIAKLPKIDLLMFGFPCKNLSRTVINNPNHNQGLKGKHSSLFYEAVRIMELVKPKYFFVENVESMKNEDRDIISEILGVNPVMIDSSIFSAQVRKRYYWTNIPFDDLPQDKGLVLKDIIQPSSEIDDKYWYKQDFTYHGDDKRPVATLHINGHDIIKRVYGVHQKAPTLTAVVGGNQQKKILQDGRVRKLTPLEYERLQTIPDNYTSGVSDSHRYRMLGDAWTVDVVAHIFKGIK